MIVVEFFEKIQIQHFWNVFFNSSQSLLELKKLLDVNLFAHWKIKRHFLKDKVLRTRL